MSDEERDGFEIGRNQLSVVDISRCQTAWEVEKRVHEEIESAFDYDLMSFHVVENLVYLHFRRMDVDD